MYVFVRAYERARPRYMAFLYILVIIIKNIVIITMFTQSNPNTNGFPLCPGSS